MPYVSLKARYNEALLRSKADIGLVTDLRERAKIIQTVFDKVFGERFDLSFFPGLEWCSDMRSPALTPLFHPKGVVLFSFNPGFRGHVSKIAGNIYVLPGWVLDSELGEVLRMARKLAKNHKDVVESERRAELNKNAALEMLEAKYATAKRKLERENWTGTYDVSVSVNRTAP